MSTCAITTRGMRGVYRCPKVPKYIRMRKYREDAETSRAYYVEKGGWLHVQSAVMNVRSRNDCRLSNPSNRSTVIRSIIRGNGSCRIDIENSAAGNGGTRIDRESPRAGCYALLSRRTSADHRHVFRHGRSERITFVRRFQFVSRA